MGNSCTRCFGAAPEGAAGAYRVHENTHHLGLSMPVVAALTEPSASRTLHVADTSALLNVPPLKAAQFSRRAPPQPLGGETTLTAAEVVAWMNPAAVLFHSLPDIRLGVAAGQDGGPRSKPTLILSKRLQGDTTSALKAVLRAPVWGGATSWLLIPLLCPSSLEPGEAGVCAIVDAVLEAAAPAPGTGPAAVSIAAHRAILSVCQCESAAVLFRESQVRLLLKILLDTLMDPGLLCPTPDQEAALDLRPRHAFGARKQSRRAISALWRTQALLSIRRLLTAASLNQLGAGFVEESVVSLVNLLPAMDAVWVLEGLLTNPTLVEAIGHGKPRKAPPAAAVHVFESIVAHVLQAWQGHKGQDDPKAGLSAESTRMIRHVLNSTCLPHAMGTSGVLVQARAWLKCAGVVAPTDDRYPAYESCLAGEWSAALMVDLLGTLMSAKGTVSVLDSHGLAQVIDMVLAGAAGEPRAAPARGGGPEFAQDSDLDIRRTQSGLLAGPPPSTGIVTSIMPGGVPAAIAGQRAGSLRETTLLVGSRRASSARPSHARGEERAPPAPPARESGAEGGSVVMGGEDSAGPGEPSVAALSGPIEAPRASPTSLQVILAMLKSDQGMPQAVVLRCLLELIRRDTTAPLPGAQEDELGPSHGDLAGLSPLASVEAAFLHVPAGSSGGVSRAGSEASVTAPGGGQSDSGDSMSVDNGAVTMTSVAVSATRREGLGRVEGEPPPNKLPTLLDQMPAFSLAREGLACRCAIRSLDPEDVKQVRNAVMAKARAMDREVEAESARQGNAAPQPSARDPESALAAHHAAAVGALATLLWSACAEAKLAPADVRATLRQMLLLGQGAAQPQDSFGPALALAGLRDFLSPSTAAGLRRGAHAPPHVSHLSPDTRTALRLLLDLSLAGPGAVLCAYRGAVSVLEAGESTPDGPRPLRAPLRQAMLAVSASGPLSPARLAATLAALSRALGVRPGRPLPPRAAEAFVREDRAAVDQALRALRDRLSPSAPREGHKAAVLTIQALLDSPLVLSLAQPATLSLCLTAILFHCAEADPDRALAAVRLALASRHVMARVAPFLDAGFASKLFSVAVCVACHLEEGGQAGMVPPRPTLGLGDEQHWEAEARRCEHALLSWFAPTAFPPAELPLSLVHALLMHGVLGPDSAVPAIKGSVLLAALERVADVDEASGDFVHPSALEVVWSLDRVVTTDTGPFLSEQFTDLVVKQGPTGACLLARVLGRNRALRLRFTPAQVQLVCQRLLDLFLQAVAEDRTACLLERSFSGKSAIVGNASNGSPLDLLFAIQAVADEQEGGSMLGRLLPGQVLALWERLHAAMREAEGVRRASLLHTLAAMAGSRDVVRQVVGAAPALLAEALALLGRTEDGSDAMAAEAEAFAAARRAESSDARSSLSATGSGLSRPGLSGDLGSLVSTPTLMPSPPGTPHWGPSVDPGALGPTPQGPTPTAGLQMAARGVLLALLASPDIPAAGVLGPAAPQVAIHAVLFPRHAPADPAATDAAWWPDEHVAAELAELLLQPALQEWLGAGGRRAVLGALARHAAAVHTGVDTGPVHPVGAMVLGTLFTRVPPSPRSRPALLSVQTHCAPVLDILHLCVLAHVPALHGIARDVLAALAEAPETPQPRDSDRAVLRRMSGPSAGLTRRVSSVTASALSKSAANGVSAGVAYVQGPLVALWVQSLEGLVTGAATGGDAPAAPLGALESGALPCAIVRGGEWGLAPGALQAVKARDLAEAAGRALGLLPVSSTTAEDVRLVLGPSAAVVPLGLPSMKAEGPRVSLQMYLAEACVNEIVPGSAAVAGKTETPSHRRTRSRGSQSSHRLSQSTGDPADTASRLTWILSTDLQLLAPFGSPTVCPVVRSLVLSLSDASLARAIDAVSVNYAAHRTSSAGAAWDLLVVPLTALAQSLGYSHLGSKSRALAQLSSVLTDFVGEATASNDSRTQACLDVTVRALCKSATGAAAILKALSGAKTVSARVRLLTIMSESGIASVVQTHSAATTILAAMKNCLAKAGRIRMWTGRRDGPAADAPAASTGADKAARESSAPERQDGAGGSGEVVTGAGVVPGLGPGVAASGVSPPPSPQGMPRSPSTNSLLIRGGTPPPSKPFRLPSAFEGAYEARSRFDPGTSGTQAAPGFRAGDDADQRAALAPDGEQAAAGGTPQTSQLEGAGVVTGSAPPGDVRGAGAGPPPPPSEGVEGIMAGVRALCQMVAYAKSSVAQDALVALSKVLAGHVGHSGRTLAAQRLHASAVVGRISIPALRALDLDKPMREMVADKNFRGFRSVACLAALVAGGEDVLAVLDPKTRTALGNAAGQGPGGAAVQEEGSSSGLEATAAAEMSAASRQGHYSAFKTLLVLATAKGGSPILPQATMAAALLVRAGDRVLTEANDRLGSAWLGHLLAAGLSNGASPADPTRALASLQVLACCPPSSGGALASAIGVAGPVLAARIDSLLQASATGGVGKGSSPQQALAPATPSAAAMAALGSLAAMGARKLFYIILEGQADSASPVVDWSSFRARFLAGQLPSD